MINFKLSILICSLEKRKESLDRLLSVLKQQKTDEVEILVDVDNGEKIIGQKRNDLLEKSTGDYVCFIDDDDLVSDDYISRILDAIKSKKDCITFRGIWIDRHGVKQIRWKKDIKKIEKKNNCYYIYANHITPVKREIAIKCKFSLKSIGEDADYAKRISEFLNDEYYIDKNLYIYNCDISHRDTNNALRNHGV